MRSSVLSAALHLKIIHRQQRDCRTKCSQSRRQPVEEATELLKKVLPSSDKKDHFCVNCGVKLTRVNRKEKTRKCYKCYMEEQRPALEQHLVAPRGYCDICGVKLTLFNMTTRQLYDKKFQRCSGCTIREKEESFSDALIAKQLASRGYAEYKLRYIGGVTAFSKHRLVSLRLYPTHIVIPEFSDSKLYTIPYDNIRSLHSETGEHITATRMLLIGLFAFALKKKTHYLLLSLRGSIWDGANSAV